MSVTITAVTAMGAESLTPPATPPTNVERDLQEFATSLSNSPMAGLPQAANPATLVGEVFGGLNGYFDKAQVFQKRVMSPDPRSDSGGGVAVASLADQPLGSDGAGKADDGEAWDPKVGFAELQRAEELAIQSQVFLAETAVVTNVAASVAPIVNGLVKGQ